jgi:hypothetical protein
VPGFILRRAFGFCGSTGSNSAVGKNRSPVLLSIVMVLAPGFVVIIPVFSNSFAEVSL